MKGAKREEDASPLCRELKVLIEERRAAKEKAGPAFVADVMVDVLLTIPETEDLTLENLIYVLLDLLNACEVPLLYLLLHSHLRATLVLKLIFTTHLTVTLYSSLVPGTSTVP